MATYTVSTTAQLLSALRSARSGDVVQLESGTYSAVTIRGLNLNNVTIESKNADQPAVLTDLLIRDSSGLTVRNVDFDLTGKSGNPFQVLRSNNVTIDNVHVHGTLNRDPSDDPATGLMIRESRNVTVTNSEFEELFHGIAHLDSRGLDISDNSFHHLRTDGIRGGGSSDVLIAGNRFTDFFPAPGDHPDAIQFWSANTAASVFNITVRDNVITRGDGGAMQGIFFRSSTDNVWFNNVHITNNVVVGGMYNGISIERGRLVVIDENVIAGFSDMNSWIRTENSVGVRVTDNTSSDYIFNRSSHVFQSDNVETGRVLDGGAQALELWESRQREAQENAPQLKSKPTVLQAPSGANPEAASEGAASGHDLFDGPLAPVESLARRGGGLDRASDESFGRGLAPHEALRAHIEALRLAVEGPETIDDFAQPAASPLFDDPLIDTVHDFALTDSSVFESAVETPVAEAAQLTATVDLALFVPAWHFPGLGEHIL